MKQEFITKTPAETEAVGAAFAETLKGGDFVAMFGDLGAGKTAFVRGAMQTLGAGVRVQSPTYTIVNEYPAKTPVYHFDMYRIDDEDALYSIGYYDYLASGGICFAEWCEKIEPYLPDEYYTVVIRRAPEDDDLRVITIETHIG